MGQIDYYEKRLEDALKKNDDNELRATVAEAVDVLAVQIPNFEDGLDSCNQIHAFVHAFENQPAPYDNIGDARKALAKIRLFKESHQNKFNEKYGTSVIDDYINRCDNFINNENAIPQEAEELVEEIATIYSPKIKNFDVVLQEHGKQNSSYRCAVRDIQKIKGMLREYRDEIIRTANSKSSLANLQQSNHQSVSVAISFGQTLSQVWELPDSILNEKQKARLSKLLSNLNKSKGLGSRQVMAATKEIGIWLFQNSMGAIPTVMPLIIQVIRSAV